MAADIIIDGRECGSCSYCCKLLRIMELEKPPGEWCPNCDIGNGCKIYDNRPSECRSFICGYLTWEKLGPHWFPEQSKMIVVANPQRERIVINVEPNHPTAWRKEPYYSEMMQWLKLAIDGKSHIVVNIDAHAIVVFADREIDLGVIAEDERLIVGNYTTTLGEKLNATKMKADDPRIAQMAADKKIQHKF